MVYLCKLVPPLGLFLSDLLSYSLLEVLRLLFLVSWLEEGNMSLQRLSRPIKQSILLFLLFPLPFLPPSSFLPYFSYRIYVNKKTCSSSDSPCSKIYIKLKKKSSFCNSYLIYFCVCIEKIDWNDLFLGTAKWLVIF